MLGVWGEEIFDLATGEDWSLKNGGPGETVHNEAYRLSHIDEYGEFVHYGCTVLQTLVPSNQFNATLTYPQLALFNTSEFFLGEDVELYISVCRVNDCPVNQDWDYPYLGFDPGSLLPHYLFAGDIIPVSIIGQLPCTLGFVMDAGGSCQQQFVCTDSMFDVGSGIYSSTCESVIISEQSYVTTNHTLQGVGPSIFFDGGTYGDSTIYVCDANADAYFEASQYGTIDVYILTGNHLDEHYTWASGSSSNQGSITINSGGSFHWDLSQYSDISFLDWTDPDGVC